ncbi:MAG TPA: PTS system mannose/fructose/sorbose family transporter subunit IID [Candidatus Eisenbacteria bacterium]|nr:PTS system mannose/fructose/sorbose family transporter subunit IID [Candidatus Eisenbacteria bacterium]
MTDFDAPTPPLPAEPDPAPIVSGDTPTAAAPAEPTPPEAPTPPRTLRSRDLGAAAWRLFQLQALLTPGRMQGPGFAFAMAPVLRRLYPDRDRFAEALARHTAYVATHPILSGYVLGAAVRLEAKRAAGESIGGDRIDAIKRALASPLAAIGDPFFWVVLRPLAGLVAVLGIALFGAANPFEVDLRVLLCPLLLLLTYNAVALPTRFRGVRAGFASAESPASLLRSLRFADWRDVLERSGAFLYGALLALLATGVYAAASSGGSGLGAVGAALLPLALGFTAARLFLRRGAGATVETALTVLTLATLVSLAL